MMMISIMGKIYKICKDVNDILYIGTTCKTLKKCLSKFKKESEKKLNWYIFFGTKC